MNECLGKMLLFITFLSIINTFINVIHKMELIHGPPAHVAMAILCMIILFGYSGILNTLFLKRRFMLGRIAYMIVAMGSQSVVLILSILAWMEIITYLHAIAIIHAIFGFIVTINFMCAVWCVEEQRKDLQEVED